MRVAEAAHYALRAVAPTANDAVHLATVLGRIQRLRQRCGAHGSRDIPADALRGGVLATRYRDRRSRQHRGTADHRGYVQDRGCAVHVTVYLFGVFRKWWRRGRASGVRRCSAARSECARRLAARVADVGRAAREARDWRYGAAAKRGERQRGHASKWRRCKRPPPSTSWRGGRSLWFIRVSCFSSCHARVALPSPLVGARPQLDNTR